MKKTIISILILGGFVSGLTNCSDLKFGDGFLEKAPGGDVTVDTIFSSKLYADRALNSAYATLRCGLTMHNPSVNGGSYEHQNAGNKLAWDNLDALTDIILNGKWADYAGKIVTLGLVSGEDPTLNYVQIPMGDGTQWSDSFTQDDYKAMVADMFDGKVTVSNDTKKAPTDFATAITVNDQGQIKG